MGTTVDASVPTSSASYSGRANRRFAARGLATRNVDYRIRHLAAADLQVAPSPPGVAPTPRRIGNGRLIAARLEAAGLPGVVRVTPLEALPDTYVLSLGKTPATPAVLERLRAALLHHGFHYRYVEASYRLRPATGGSVIDPDFGVNGAGQWGLLSVRANVAWPRIRISQGRDKTIVAVIDSGIASRHPDLIHELWHPDPTRQAGLPANPDDRPFGKTFIDGITEDTAPEDDWSHGTHVAGIIGAESDNYYAVKSVMLKGTVQLMIAKIFSSDDADAADATDADAAGGATAATAVSTGCTDNLIRAVDYVIDPYLEVDPPDANFEPFTTHSADAVAMASIRAKADDAGGATIVNLSSYEMQYSQALEYYLKWVALYFRRVLLVVAAPDNIGISRLGPGANVSYPASLGLANVLVVSGSNQDRCLMYPFGRSVADIAAPSKDVRSTVLPGLGDGTKESGGTSAATPFVSGAAALVQYLGPDSWGYTEIKEKVLRSAQDLCIVGTPAEKSSYESKCPYRDDIDSVNALTQAPSLCKAVRSNGLLDVDAATAPPIERLITGADGKRHNGILIAPAVANGKYASGSNITVSWHLHTPAPGNFSESALPLCPRVDIDVIGGKATVDLSDPSRAPLATESSVDIKLESKNIRLPTVPAARRVRVRIQCSDSHLFRLSDSFTVKAP
jgi:subtilisin family serine protease